MIKNCNLYFFLNYDNLSEILINTFLQPVNLVASEEIVTVKEKC
jgi:hypothetical protein